MMMNDLFRSPRDNLKGFKIGNGKNTRSVDVLKIACGVIRVPFALRFGQAISMTSVA